MKCILSYLYIEPSKSRYPKLLTYLGVFVSFVVNVVVSFVEGLGKIGRTRRGHSVGERLKIVKSKENGYKPEVHLP